MATDNLKMMMDLQNKLQLRLGLDFKNMSDEERVAQIKEFSIHVGQELNEMLYELPFFKPWKDYSSMPTEDIDMGFYKAQKEFIDLWHFILNLALLLDLDANKLFHMYWSKNTENHQRQDEGYTHDKQYR